jgi:hypothetical protein
MNSFGGLNAFPVPAMFQEFLLLFRRPHCIAIMGTTPR